jgi:hypothetical protein
MCTDLAYYDLIHDINYANYCTYDSAAQFYTCNGNTKGTPKYGLYVQKLSVSERLSYGAYVWSSRSSATM